MRKVINLNKNWIFTGQADRKTTVDIPHTWNAEDGTDGGNDYYRAQCSYVKEFDRPAYDEKSEEIYIEFHAANSSAEVIINGVSLGVHHGGYSLFRYLLSPYLREKNRLEVLVDNSPNDFVYPQRADFTFYGGIYRDVNLLIVNKNHFDLLDYGTPGLKITPRAEGPDASVEVETFTHAPSFEVEIVLTDAAGNIVAQSRSAECRSVLTIKKARRWHGQEDPYLYHCKATLYVGGEAKDEVSSHFGVREFKVDPDKGFYLNGRPYPLRGVCRHQDFEGKGNAIGQEEQDIDMALIQEVGANTIRLAHYQHNQYFYNLCDKLGYIVWAEIPYISEHLPKGKENSRQQMIELITQNYNHPCIVVWGVSNEITIVNKHKKDMLAHHHELNDLCHKMDPTRLTTLACYAMCNPLSKIAHLTDLVSFNYYLGWYVPGLFLNDFFLKTFHLLYPKRPVGYAEYGADALPYFHSEKPKRADHTEEYQAIYHEYLIECFERHPFIWATHLWNMFDFGADARAQGGAPGKNYKGLVTFDRKIKKDSFYLYKLYWNPEPLLHICSKRFVKRAQDQIEVKVYSNQKEVSLYNNGRLVEKKQGDKIFRFSLTLEDRNEVKVKAGTLEDTAYFEKVAEMPAEYILDKSKRKSSNWTGD